MTRKKTAAAAQLMPDFQQSAGAAAADTTTIMKAMKSSTQTREPPRRGRPSRAEQTVREDVVLEIALEEFLQNGLDGSNIEVIARKAGVGKSTIYRKYVNKQGLLLAVANQELAELGARWGEVNFDINDPEGTLYQIALTSYREWSGRSLPLYRIIYGEATRLPELAQEVHTITLKKAMWPVTDYIRALKDRGVIDVEDFVEAASMFLMIAVGGTRFLILPANLDKFAQERLAKDAVQLFLYGFARHPKGQRDNT